MLSFLNSPFSSEVKRPNTSYMNHRFIDVCGGHYSLETELTNELGS